MSAQPSNRRTAMQVRHDDDASPANLQVRHDGDGRRTVHNLTCKSLFGNH
ncbi:hypothetical protein Hanom_Chr09g00791391 [Helianthus anomalus]